MEKADVNLLHCSAKTSASLVRVMGRKLADSERACYVWAMFFSMKFCCAFRWDKIDREV